MYKVTITITNSVNDDVITKIKVCDTKKEADNYIEEQELEVQAWNKEAADWRSGIQSHRYFDSDLDPITRETPVDGLTVGDLQKILNYISDDSRFWG